MLTVLVMSLLSQPSLKLAVLDVSAPDAIYQDVSTGLADRLSEAFLKRGFLACRIDETQVPPKAEGCRLGPCLGIIAAAHQVDVLVILDATETDKGIDVTLSAMRGRDGLPLAAGKWATTAAGKPTKKLTRFLDATTKAAAKQVTSP